MIAWDGLVQDDFNSIYIKSSTSKADAMWLASPSTYGNNYLMDANHYGSVDSYGYSSLTPGLRPIVCLKPGVQLEKQTDGTFMIVK